MYIYVYVFISLSSNVYAFFFYFLFFLLKKKKKIHKVKLFRKMEAIAKALPRKKVFQRTSWQKQKQKQTNKQTNKRYEENELPMIALFDCGNTNDEHAEQICKQLLPGGTPNILIYRRMSKPRLLPKEYRSDNQIVGYLHGLMQPPVTFLEERSQCEDFVTDDRYLNVLFFGTDDTSVFESVADSLRDFARFARTKNPSNAEAFFASVPSILAWRTFGENPIAFGGNLSDAQAIHTFVLNQYLPALGEFNEHTQQQYIKRGLPVVWIAFDSNDDATARLLLTAEGIAGQYLGALSFVKLDVFEQPKIAENFELIPKKEEKAEGEDDSSTEENSKKLPQVLIMNQLAQLKQPINLDDIEGSINNVVNQYFQGYFLKKKKKKKIFRGDVQSELEGVEDDTDDDDEADGSSETAVEDDDDDDEDGSSFNNNKTERDKHLSFFFCFVCLNNIVAFFASAYAPDFTDTIFFSLTIFNLQTIFLFKD
ncbi:hypothetical protein RFI_27038 [Reticulomyxa filosa]|uniref:protein disulfide-isomerase n=1 Tax=Reticulomyxa filosa TaxID=46433 RepID=X6M9N0_RETFI|nr:hypothetical protein RFI_27038 [Reticulomyxa filosa]|eukprot:ETO10341.1 hypothetical protein RFI_27038 [Reticulomyxa filosa]